MTKAISINRKTDRDHRNIHDDLSFKLSEIYAVASLLAVVDSDEVFIGQLNVTGQLLTGMIDDAQEIAREHYELWLGGAK